MPDVSPEISAIQAFVQKCLPFNELSDEQLAFACHQMEILYLRAGSELHPDFNHKDIRIIRSGALELRSGADQLLDRLGEKENFNLCNLAAEEPDIRAIVIEDSLIYRLDNDIHSQLRTQNRNFDRFFHSQRNRRLRRAVMLTPANNLLMGPIDHVMSHKTICVAPQAHARKVAQTMVAEGVSSVMICEHDQLVGIATDRDLRSRLLAQGLSYDTPISAIMTEAPTAISRTASMFDAMLLMSEHGIHHLPVVEDADHDRRPKGMLTMSDLIRNREQDPVYLVQFIHKQTSLAGLQRAAASLPGLLTQWTDSGVRAYQLAQIFTSVSDAITRRLITLAQEELGPAPAAFAWLGFGSQGRAEQALGGDQDNALVYADDAPKDADTYFKALAHKVCDGLNACGYVYCPGGIMATTDTWRQPLAKWQQTVNQWTDEPTLDAVMRVSIFFDIRAIHGDQALAQSLQSHMLKMAGSNDIFLAALARNAGTHRPPLGFFRRFVLERNGEHAHQLDLKHRGIIPIVDLARVYALAHGVSAVNTRERIRKLGEIQALTLADSRNISDALEYIQSLRLLAQARQLSNHQKTSNYLDPASLPELQREQLRDAFTAVNEAQEALILKFGRGLSA
ncbi:putative nucleotidyltransferase substrate binding domain-containing protein [Simiduia agarivorans]|uniref:CBS domain and cyclic nucleotide-regulated nucleotidyltransferase n=1 Tax=Simiduia agarivorans (strain DSM 21679 / JCM 13881 / BCRC 17597 / SA1) TaxID=1117647 RepID=K4KU98_SIMAS|nr:putative nucleotidyltransferase substrate binding domain-containing protein [Simiduia agarivorans]AFU97542.1 CBS domain and cyclic nucleotide-regulated nucleotidyltransferase [Simiduia agarivorans SA1 = DSM 21679]